MWCTVGWFDNYIDYFCHAVTMIRENKVLTSLKLFYCLLSPEYLCELCTAVGVNTTLTVLDLSFNKFVDDKSIGSLSKLLIQ